MGRVVILDPAAISGVQSLAVEVKLVPVLININVSVLWPVVVAVDPVTIGPNGRPSTINSLRQMGNVEDKKTLAKRVLALKSHTASTKLGVLVIFVGVVYSNEWQSVLVVVSPKAQVVSIYRIAVVDKTSGRVNVISIRETRYLALDGVLS